MPSTSHIARNIGEVLSLRTKRDIRDNRTTMSNAQVARHINSVRFAVAGSLTALVINSSLALLMPPFYAIAGVNLWQSAVALTNHHRAKDEINRRVKADPQLKKLFKDRRRRAIFTGVCLKVLTSGLAIGLDDIGSIADAFMKLDGAVPPDEMPSKVIEHFKAEFPNLAAADDGLQDITSGIADNARDKLGETLLGQPHGIDTETTTQGLSVMHQQNSTEDMMISAAVPGFVGELTQPFLLPIELCADAARNWRFDQRQQNNKINVQGHKLQDHKLS